MNLQLTPYDQKIIEELGFRKIDESHDFIEFLFKPNKTIKIIEKKRFSEQVSMIMIGFSENGIPKEELFIQPSMYHENFQIFKDPNFMDEFLMRFLEKEELQVLEVLAFQKAYTGISKFHPAELNLESLRSNFKPNILKYNADENFYDFRRPEFWYSLVRTYIYKTKSGHPKGVLAEIKEEAILSQVNWRSIVENTIDYESMNKVHRKKINDLVKEAEYELAAIERNALDQKIRELAIRDWPNFSRKS